MSIKRRGGRFLRIGRPLIAILVAEACRPRLAQAQIGTIELFDRLSWLLVVPLGVVQTIAALWVGRQIGSSAVRGVLLATLVALVVALAGAMFVDEGPLRVLMLLIYFVPGVPTFVLLGRKKMWGLASLLFLIPPAPFVLFPR